MKGTKSKTAYKPYAQLGKYKGLDIIELSACGYSAMIAPSLGGNVLRLRNDEQGVEIFRFDADKSAEEIADAIEIHGLPTMYLPNRLDGGLLKTSDGEYHLPVNEPEPYRNCLHGFLHRRSYKVDRLHCDREKASAEISFEYTEEDEFFKYLPLSFTAQLCFTLSETGFDYKFTITNNSEKQLPVSVATHTTINAPFADGGRQEDIRLCAPIGKRCVLNERCLPSEDLAELTPWDKEYASGEKCPVLQVINNDMYFAGCMEDENGTSFHGLCAVDTASGKTVYYETSEEYGFWIFWNEWGFKGYFCPEPMTAMINAPNLSLPAELSGYRELAPEESFTCTQHIRVGKAPRR